jgi:hypothetical protein
MGFLEAHWVTIWERITGVNIFPIIIPGSYEHINPGARIIAKVGWFYFTMRPWILGCTELCSTVVTCIVIIIGFIWIRAVDWGIGTTKQDLWTDMRMINWDMWTDMRMINRDMWTDMRMINRILQMDMIIINRDLWMDMRTINWVLRTISWDIRIISWTTGT